MLYFISFTFIMSKYFLRLAGVRPEDDIRVADHKARMTLAIGMPNIDKY